MNKMKNRLIFTILVLFAAIGLSAEPITFSGGTTKVSLQDGDHRVNLSGGANVQTEKVTLSSDSVELYGEDYSYVDCTGSVKVTEKERNISISCANLFYNRTENMLISDGWIEIDDPEHEATLSGSWFEYNTDTSVMKLQMQARIRKNTDSGMLVCSSDSIEYNADEQTLILKGSAVVTWGDDTYKASMIVVDIDTEDISLHGSISGEVNGN